VADLAARLPHQSGIFSKRRLTLSTGSSEATASSEEADVVLTVDCLERVGEARQIAQEEESYLALPDETDLAQL
jgi:hypothetical protein